MVSSVVRSQKTKKASAMKQSVLFLLTLPTTITAWVVVKQEQKTFSSFCFKATASDDDDDWHPHDPAYSTPQLLVGLWDQIAMAGSMVRGESQTVIYPQMEEQLNSPRYLNLVLAHLDACKDVCDHFGITTTLVPFQDPKSRKVTGFTVKSYRKPDSNDDGEYNFEYDAFWDDGTDFDALYAGVDDEDMQADPYPEIVNKVPSDDDEIIGITKKWVNKIMSDMGICPFTAGPDKAGLPMGNVYYHVDRHSGFEDVYAAYWKEVVRLEQNDEKDMSTILLVLPEFLMDNVELFDSFTTTLTTALTALQVEDLLQLVFFHPHWSFRDGSARSGEGQAANYARRSPWPMINLLRTKQVRAAQKGIPTGLVYKQNEKTLSTVGVDQLETMLRLRDWSAIADMKVNRREYDALKIAQDYQQTGRVDPKDTSLAFDATPAANKVNREQVEKGNLVNVVVQALEKRLGITDGAITPLNGPETSATAMAVDFLLEELVNMPQVDEKSEPGSQPKIDATEEAEGEHEEPDELARAKQERFEAARRALLSDLEEQSQRSDRGDRSTDVIFGKGGIPDNAEEDAMFQEGMNPDSFY